MNRDKLVQLLSEIEAMWDRHLGHIKQPRHQMELMSSDICPVHSTPYRARPAARQFFVKEIKKMPQEEDNEPANTK